ncbi:MAG TPA: hypothetical protein VM677_18710 [Actinokineospora sp.]|jgi:hypothetical protein|nr:hypothetical protein [Actinokineospora sp.]
MPEHAKAASIAQATLLIGVVGLAVGAVYLVAHLMIWAVRP